jgi:hypothetical protein
MLAPYIFLTSTSVRERRKNEEIARQERDRRRRRGIIDQLTAQAEMEAKKRSEMLNSKLIKMSENERKIAESLYQVHCHSIP